MYANKKSTYETMLPKCLIIKLNTVKIKPAAY